MQTLSKFLQQAIGYKHSLSPDRFSTRTMEAIKSGLVTKGIRVEIITAIAIQMMRYTMQPTSEVHV